VLVHNQLYNEFNRTLRDSLRSGGCFPVLDHGSKNLAATGTSPSRLRPGSVATSRGSRYCGNNKMTRQTVGLPEGRAHSGDRPGEAGCLEQKPMPSPTTQPSWEKRIRVYTKKRSAELRSPGCPSSLRRHVTAEAVGGRAVGRQPWRHRACGRTRLGDRRYGATAGAPPDRGQRARRPHA